MQALYVYIYIKRVPLAYCISTEYQYHVSVALSICLTNQEGFLSWIIGSPLFHSPLLSAGADGFTVRVEAYWEYGPLKHCSLSMICIL